MWFTCKTISGFYMSGLNNPTAIHNFSNNQRHTSATSKNVTNQQTSSVFNLLPTIEFHLRVTTIKCFCPAASFAVLFRPSQTKGFPKDVATNWNPIFPRWRKGWLGWLGWRDGASGKHFGVSPSRPGFKSRQWHLSVRGVSAWRRRLTAREPGSVVRFDSWHLGSVCWRMIFGLCRMASGRARLKYLTISEEAGFALPLDPGVDHPWAWPVNVPYISRRYGGRPAAFSCGPTVRPRGPWRMAGVSHSPSPLHTERWQKDSFFFPPSERCVNGIETFCAAAFKEPLATQTMHRCLQKELLVAFSKRWN